jgi:hypothetical protein
MAGFKTFVDLDILTAAEVNDFLMTQAVMVFDDAAARTAALPTPLEGMVTYLKSTDELDVYTGAAWVIVNDNTAAILKSTLAAKGDLISASGAATPVAVSVGTNGQVLTADSTQTGGLTWTTPVAALNDLSDVDAAAPGNNQVLTYKTATSKWEAETPTGAADPVPTAFLLMGA